MPALGPRCDECGSEGVMTARDTLPADPELLAARPPNPARGARPGWRGTDPDGGTWVRRAANVPLDRCWLVVLPDGEQPWRAQEEAEAAGLVPLDVLSWWEREVLDAARKAFTGDADPGEQIIETDDYTVRVSRWDGDEDDLAAPAPLDPGNPERFRQAAESAREMAKSPHLDTATWEHIAATFESQADRLDREHAEAEQDASDRAEADNYAKESSTTEEFWARHNAYLDGIRAERARQEAGQ